MMRYDYGTDLRLWEDPNGDWVRYEDVKELEAKLAAVREKAECWLEIPGGVQACGEDLLALLATADAEKKP